MQQEQRREGQRVLYVPGVKEVSGTIVRVGVGPDGQEEALVQFDDGKRYSVLVAKLLSVAQEQRAET